MAGLTWGITSNIENSIIDFLQSEITNDSLTLLDANGIAKPISVYVGREVNQSWNLPLIQVYLDSKPDLGRLEIGSNLRLKSWLIIFDIRTILPGQETNLADWVETVINDGVTIYDYTINSLNPPVPVKSILGHGRIDFISSNLIPSYDDADVYDKNRYRISAKLWLNWAV
jgi:hypothetical protein